MGISATIFGDGKERPYALIDIRAIVKTENGIEALEALFKEISNYLENPENRDREFIPSLNINIRATEEVEITS